MNKMAFWLDRKFGYTQICEARGTVSWGNNDNDAVGELQLWYQERRNDYFIYAGIGETWGTGYMEVCKLF